MYIDSFSQELQGKINKYIKKHKNKYLVYIKTIFYCINKIFNIPTNMKGNISKLPKNVLKIAIRLDGGLGDVLVYGLWVKEFSKIIDCPFIIDIFPSRSIKISNTAFKENTFINKIYNFSYFENNVKNYDLALSFKRFPYVVYCNSKVKKFSQKIYEFAQKYNDFKNENIKFFVNGASCDTLMDLYSICRNEKRIQQPDIDNLLNINEDTKLYLPLNSDSFNVLKEYNLEDCKYITLTRSVAQDYEQKENIRLWPIEYYEELISKLKQKYPDIKIVQLGVSRCEELKGVDINLLGKTDLEQVKVILKHCVLHIDGECGMVHIKHFLYGKSAVFFAQTAIEYLGYENNINLKSNGCSHWCEWIVDDWQTHCVRGFKHPPCMTELKPDYVFENITPYLDSVANSNEKTFEIKELENVKKYFSENKITNKKIVFYGKEFFELAKELSSNNKCTIYDCKLDNSEIHNANNIGILMEYGDICNIPEKNDAVDIYVSYKINNENYEYCLKEAKRIANTILIQTTKEIWCY